MKNDGGPRSGGFFSLRAISSYLRIVSSGASTVASTVRSAGASVASSIADHGDDADRDSVHWAGFDKLECEDKILRQVLLLGYRSGFQVWDVEDANDVRLLVSKYDGTVSFLQMQKQPILPEGCEDHYTDVRPLLVISVDGSIPLNGNDTDSVGLPCNGNIAMCQDPGSDCLVPTYVRFYSLKTHDYVKVLKFRSPVYSIRCSPRVVAISQSSQIHCFNAATLDREYTILTCPILPLCPGSGSIGCGPLALGSRWLAYSGNPVTVSGPAHVSPQHLGLATGFSSGLSNGSFVAHCAKESSKQLAAGILTLGDMGYKKISKYCLELVPDNSSTMKHLNDNIKIDSTANDLFPETENVGMVIVRDIVSKSVVVQFRAHKSPISALAFSPSGTLLVTASVHGHNINIFRMIPALQGNVSGSDARGSCIHLYRLQRGITNAVIQDISFSDDSRWIMVSSSRGTNHLFSLSPGESGDLQYNDNSIARVSNNSDPVLNHQSLFGSGSSITLSATNRIRNGSNGWKGAIASAFYNGNVSRLFSDTSPLRTNYYLLVFSPSGCIIQYVLRHSTSEFSTVDVSHLRKLSNNASVSLNESDIVVEALKKWDVCKQNRRDQCDNVDIYGERGNGESTKYFPKGLKKGSSIYPADSGGGIKVKLSVEEKHHMYISEVELQMHSSRHPLWAKSKIHFHVMVDENIKGNISALYGEFEIESIPTRSIEVRTKNLIPVYDNLQAPGFTQASKRNGLSMQQASGLLDDERNSCRSSCSSFDGALEIAEAVGLHNDFKDQNLGDSQPLADSNTVAVNNEVENSNTKTQPEHVHNTEGLKPELEHVNNEENLKIVKENEID